MTPTEIAISPTSEILYRDAAHALARALHEAILARGTAFIALAGGNTPRGLYQELARLPAGEAPKWAQVQFYFGDERAVPPEHPESNYRMARENLFEPLQIPPSQVHRIEAECLPDQALSRYRQQLELLPRQQGWPCFDVVLLGMGADGHVASLFPDSALLAQGKEVFSSAEVAGHGRRYSLTLPVLNHARQLMLLVAGRDKAATLRTAIEEANAGLPVQALHAERLSWYLDSEAASALRQRSP